LTAGAGFRASTQDRPHREVRPQEELMPQFAANLTMLSNELPFLDRFAAAVDAGFDAVEFMFPCQPGRAAGGGAWDHSGILRARERRAYQEISSQAQVN
jgi:hypothetical protein